MYDLDAGVLNARCLNARYLDVRISNIDVSMLDYREGGASSLHGKVEESISNI